MICILDFTGKVKFDPRLPPVKRELHKRMPMANYAKVVITYKKVLLTIIILS